MKKTINFYLGIWLLSVALFNVIVFVTPSDWGNKFNGSFWAGYIFITLAFIAQLICAAIALKSDTLSKVFYRLSAISACYIGLAVMLIAGSISMLIPIIQPWAGIILCTIVLVINIISILKSTVAATIVEDIDQKIAEKTAFIKDITAETEALSYSASTPDLKAEVKKVYEAFRYSDPMDNTVLTDINGQISAKLCDFSDAVRGNDLEAARSIGNDLIALIERRNITCKKHK